VRILAASAESTARRIPVVHGRVACPHLGLVDLDRCRECSYLSCLEETDADGHAAASVYCSFTTAERIEMDY
jgi:hypothetical protein